MFTLRRWTVATAAALMVCLLAAGVPGLARAATAPLTFSAPTQIAGAPYTSGHNLTALDCRSTTLCVGGDGVGNLVVSTDPTAGASAWTLTEQVDPGAQITAVSCVSATLCVAAANDGAILHSTTPTGAASSWKKTTGVFNTGNYLNSLSCPSATLCVGVDRKGQVVVSRTPTGAAKSWTFAKVLNVKSDWLAGIDCPTTTECVAIDKFGHTVLHSLQPAGGKADWHPTTLPNTQNANSDAQISCASTKLCVIAGEQGKGRTPFIATAGQRPVGGKDAWKVGRGPGTVDEYDTVSCPTFALCVVAGNGFGPAAAVSANPQLGASSYRVGLTDPSDPPTGYPSVAGISCASDTQCVFYSGQVGDATQGEIGVSTFPDSPDSSDWPTFVVDADNPLTSIACPSVSECIAGGPEQDVYSSADPSGGAGRWTATPLPITSDHVACGATDQCVVGDGETGDLAASSTPLSGGWIEAQTSGDLPDGGGIAVLACAAGPFCIAGPYEVQSDSDDEGTTALISTDPTGGTSAWNYSESFIEGGVNGGPHPAKGTVNTLTCPSASLCVAGDADGGVLSNTDPRAIGGWRYVHVDGSASITSLSCPSTTLCVGVDSDGQVISSTQPATASLISVSGHGAWKKTTIDPRYPLTAVACASADWCVAVDGHGHAFVSSDPTGAASTWKEISGVDGDLTSIACPAVGDCVAVDGEGNEVTTSS
jgi:hypothetical protein